MSNLEQFNTFARKDFEEVRKGLNGECNEDKNWKMKLEALTSSLESLLMDMDITEKGGIN